MRAALVAHERVDFVDDDRADGAQDRAALLRGEHQVERFGRGDQDVRRALDDHPARRLWRVAGAHDGADARHRRAPCVSAAFGPLPRELGHFAQRLLEVALNVVGERLERGDVEDARLVGQLALLLAEAHELVDPGQKRRQRLAGAGRRGEQHIAPRANRRPAGKLGVGGRLKARAEPLRHERVEVGEDVGSGRGLAHMFRSLAA